LTLSVHAHPHIPERDDDIKASDDFDTNEE